MSSQEQVTELNEQFACLTLQGKSAVLHLEDGDYTVWTHDAMNKHLANQKITVTTDGTNGQDTKKIGLYEAWLYSPLRRTYVDVAFDPTNKCPERKFNLWQKDFEKEERKGDVTVYLDHLRDVICSGNEEYFLYLCAWFADLYQNFDCDNKPGVSVALRGKRGTGKTKAVEPHIKIFGKHAVSIEKSEQTLGRFNSLLHNKILVCAEEAFYAGAKASEMALKHLITGDKFNIELKGYEPFDSPNYVKLILCSNNEWIAPCGDDERRFFVLDVSSDKIGDRKYFETLTSFCRSHLPEILYYFRHYAYNVQYLRDPPKTTAMTEQVLKTLLNDDPCMGLFHGLLESGELPGYKMGENTVTTDAIQELFQSEKITRSQSSSLGKKRDILNIERIRGSVSQQDRERAKRQCITLKDRPWTYKFPPLAECRALFDKHYNTNFPWQGDTEWTYKRALTG